MENDQNKVTVLRTGNLGIFNVTRENGTIAPVGSQFTLDGVYEQIPNPDRHWWTPWRPRTINSDKLKTFTVIAHSMNISHD